jgi:hypothetical protein
VEQDLEAMTRMEADVAIADVAPSARAARSAVNRTAAGGNVVLAAVLMLATLPGRTRGWG